MIIIIPASEMLGKNAEQLLLQKPNFVNWMTIVVILIVCNLYSNSPMQGERGFNVSHF